nr:MAG TPA_asm: hypothetical protein [Caudoviricetes sp.]
MDNRYRSFRRHGVEPAGASSQKLPAVYPTRLWQPLQCLAPVRCYNRGRERFSLRRKFVLEPEENS